MALGLRFPLEALHQAKESLAPSAQGRNAKILVFRLIMTWTYSVMGNLDRHAEFTENLQLLTVGDNLKKRFEDNEDA